MELPVWEESVKVTLLANSTSRQVVTEESRDDEQRLSKQSASSNSSEVEDRVWKAFYEDTESARTPSEAELAIEHDLLNKAWREFIPDPQDKGKAGTSKLSPSNATVSMKELINIVTAVKDQQKKQGRAHRYLEKFCKSLSSHQTMISTLPDQSIYASIFCGVLKTLISASANHRKIIEALSKDLMEIGEVVQHCVLQAQLFVTSDMKDLVHRLYTFVFSFLRKALRWYEDKRRNRLLNSFNENYYGSFSDTLNEIRNIGKLIHTKGIIANHAETRDMRGILEKIREDQKKRTSDEEYWERKYKNMEEQYEMFLDIGTRQRVAALMNKFLSNDASSLAPLRLMFNTTGTAVLEEQIEDREVMDLSNNLDTDLKLLTEEPHPSQRYIKADLQYRSRVLEDHMIQALDPHDVYEDTYMFVEHQVAHALQEWIGSMKSQVLWIIGQPDRRYPSSVSPVAAVLCNSADEAAIPSLNLFLDWPFNEESSISGALYSLIRQLTSLLPDCINTAIDLGPERFAALDGSVASWDMGLSIFRDLLALAPPFCLLIVDGIEHLDHLSVGSRYMEGLLKVLQEAVQAQEGRTFKVLFTTAGNCATLNGLNETVLTVVKASETHPRNPGRGRPGRSKLHGEFMPLLR